MPVITRRKLSAEIRRLLSNSPQQRDSKLSDRYIQLEVDQIANKLLKLEFFEAKNIGIESINSTSIATCTGISVQNDTQRKRNYIELPCYPVNLPGGYGIQEVKPYSGNVNTDVACIIIQPMELEMFRSTQTGLELVSSFICAEPIRDRVYFTRKNEKTLLELGITQMEVKLVVIDPSQIDEDDPYPISPDQENQIIMEVLKLHGYNPAQPVDLTNNSNPNL